jgi:hypothetical protein
MHTHSLWDIPTLRSDRLACTTPLRTYAGGVVNDPTRTLFIFRTASLAKARGCVMGFYVDDYRLEALWRHPEHYVDLFLRHSVTSLIEPDFSLWTDEALIQQAYNVFRMRSLGRLWQDAGLSVIPNLTWSDERSFSFCFSGIPVGTPMVACECRTPGSNDEDRRAFLRGLTEGVRQIQPRNVLIYGGMAHCYWLTGNLPKEPDYTLLESWTSARGKIRARQAREVKAINQPQLFSIGGTSQWAEEEAAAAAERNAKAGRTKAQREARQEPHAATDSQPCQSHNQ